MPSLKRRDAISSPSSKTKDMDLIFFTRFSLSLLDLRNPRHGLIRWSYIWWYNYYVPNTVQSWPSSITFQWALVALYWPNYITHFCHVSSLNSRGLKLNPMSKSWSMLLALNANVFLVFHFDKRYWHIWVSNHTSNWVLEGYLCGTLRWPWLNLNRQSLWKLYSKLFWVLHPPPIPPPTYSTFYLFTFYCLNTHYPPLPSSLSFSSKSLPSLPP